MVKAGQDSQSHIAGSLEDLTSVRRPGEQNQPAK